MRGLTHFISGMAVATFFPELTNDLLQGNLTPIIAGVSAYLPDFIDFKIKRIVEKWDVEVDPAPPDERTLISPKLRDLGDIDVNSDRYRWFSYNVRIERIVEVGRGDIENYGKFDRVVLEAIDTKGNHIQVYVIGDDINLFKKMYSIDRFEEIVGKEIKILGYVDVINGRKAIVFSDAPHPKYIAETVAKAINDAWEKGEVIVKFHNIRLPGDVFRRYSVMIPPDSNIVEVYIGPIITLGDNPVVKDLPPKFRMYGKAEIKAKVKKTYPFPITVGGFSGPSVKYRRTEDGVEEIFIPWHREFPHSITAGLVVGGVVAGLFKLLGYQHALTLGLASMLGQWMHVIEDQLGYMGSNLFAPFTKKRIKGLMLGRASSGWLNLAITYTMFVLMAWNFTRFVPAIAKSIGLNDPNFVLIYGLIPAVLAFGIGIIKGLKEKKLMMELMKKYREIGVFEETIEELTEF
ncbi:MAG: metal-dependent hydrolase [Desulfurococcaceae archaeon]|uniref:Metal-dependent hydrolase n=1 Tax=Staphylothermus marinus TaxID=2280 RepID=A0A7C4NQF7_STAMA